MELLARIKNDARRSGYFEAEEERPYRPYQEESPQLSVYKPTKQRRIFLPLATAAAVLAMLVLGVFLIRQAAGTRFTPGPAPQAGGNAVPGARSSESSEEITTVSEEIATSAAPAEEYRTVAPTPAPTEAPRNPDNPDPSIPMEQIAERTEIVEIREDGLRREIRVSGQKHRLMIPFIELTDEDDRGFQSALKMITSGCNVSITSDISWQDAPPEKESWPVKNPPFNQLMEAINLSIFGVNHPVDELAAGYRKEEPILLVFDGPDRALFLERVRKNIDDGYPVITFARGEFLLVNGYLEAENGEMLAFYYLDSNGAKHTADIQAFLEMISGVQHAIFYLW